MYRQTLVGAEPSHKIENVQKIIKFLEVWRMNTRLHGGAMHCITNLHTHTIRIISGCGSRAQFAQGIPSHNWAS
jgi:hypothetical protein